MTRTSEVVTNKGNSSDNNIKVIPLELSIRMMASMLTSVVTSP